MYAILTKMVRNVGDDLIVQSAKQLISHERGEQKFLEFYMGDDLSNHLEKINKCDALIIPGFLIRDPLLHPMRQEFFQHH